MFNVKTLIAFVLGIAFMFIGCSDVKNPTATLNPASAVMPGDDNSNSVKEAVLLESLEEQIPTQVISIIGTVHFIQERDGCIYLQPSIGEFPHELNFRFSNCPSDGLRENSAVKVIGRFNPNSYSNCVGGMMMRNQTATDNPIMCTMGMIRWAAASLIGVSTGSTRPAACILNWPTAKRLSKKGWRWN